MKKKKFVPCEIDIVLFEQEVILGSSFTTSNEYDPDDPWGMLG